MPVGSLRRRSFGVRPGRVRRSRTSRRKPVTTPGDGSGGSDEQNVPKVLERSHVLRTTVSEEKSCWRIGLEFFAALGVFVQVGVPEEGVPPRSEWHTHAYKEWSQGLREDRILFVDICRDPTKSRQPTKSMRCGFMGAHRLRSFDSILLHSISNAGVPAFVSLNAKGSPHGLSWKLGSPHAVKWSTTSLMSQGYIST